MKNHYNVPIRVGEQITIKDGSYMLAICPVRQILTHHPKIEGFMGNLVTLNHIYTVIAINVPCPSEKDITGSLRPQNNCIIIDNTFKVIWFCSTINIKTVKNLL